MYQKQKHESLNLTTGLKLKFQDIILKKKDFRVKHTNLWLVLQINRVGTNHRSKKIILVAAQKLRVSNWKSCGHKIFYFIFFLYFVQCLLNSSDIGSICNFKHCQLMPCDLQAKPTAAVHQTPQTTTKGYKILTWIFGIFILCLVLF